MEVEKVENHEQGTKIKLKLKLMLMLDFLIWIIGFSLKFMSIDVSCVANIQAESDCFFSVEL